MKHALIVHETSDFIFVNKPSGLLTIPDRHNAALPSVVGQLRLQYGEVFIVHRIDKDTSGCLVFAKNAVAHSHASQAFEKRQVTKKYLGLVHGAPPQPNGTLSNKIAEHPTVKGKMIVHAKLGKSAITHYQILEQYKGYSLIEFTIETGRMHQIRVHCSNMGCSLVGDVLYGNSTSIFVSDINPKYKQSILVENEQPILSRLALHSNYIGFDYNSCQIEATAHPHKDIQATLQQLRKWRKI